MIKAVLFYVWDAWINYCDGAQAGAFVVGLDPECGRLGGKSAGDEVAVLDAFEAGPCWCGGGGGREGEPSGNDRVEGRQDVRHDIHLSESL